MGRQGCDVVWAKQGETRRSGLQHVKIVGIDRCGGVFKTMAKAIIRRYRKKKGDMIIRLCVYYTNLVYNAVVVVMIIVMVVIVCMCVVVCVVVCVCVVCVMRV
ncbi:hypothetical protein F4810DRAFT_658097 [Camillea tinctor]|nr:hypothetical protein F4810DRAFT_658097 [Camillea tinctor]